MRTLIFFIALLFLFPQAGFSQDSIATQKSKTVGIKLGASHDVLRDNFVMPLNYMGAGATLGAFYERTTSKTRQCFNFDIHYAQLEDFLDFEALYTYPSFRYAYTWKIKNDSSPGILAFIGPMAEAQYNIYYFLQTDDSHIQWLTQYHLGVNASADIKLWKTRSLRINVEIPLVRLNSRMPEEVYNSNFNPAFGKMINMFHQDAKLVFGNSGWRFNAFYPLRETGKTSLSIGYEHFIISYNQVAIQTNSVILKYGFKK